MVELMLSRDERLRLKSESHHLEPVVLVGANGLTEAVMNEIDRALTAHELVKVRTPASEREEREQMFAHVAEHLGAARVQLIGRLMVLFRPSPEEPPHPRASRAASPASGRGDSKARSLPSPARREGRSKPRSLPSAARREGKGEARSLPFPARREGKSQARSLPSPARREGRSKPRSLPSAARREGKGEARSLRSAARREGKSKARSLYSAAGREGHSKARSLPSAARAAGAASAPSRTRSNRSSTLAGGARGAQPRPLVHNRMPFPAKGRKRGRR